MRHIIAATTEAPMARTDPRPTMANQSLEPSCVPLEEQAELLEYARAIEAGTVQLEHAGCEQCGWFYIVGHGGYPSCPRCNEQSLSLYDQLHVVQRWPGHDFVWCQLCYRWRPAQDVVCLPREELREVAELLPVECQGMPVAAGVVHELTRLRRIIAEADLPNTKRAEREAKRASELADECGRLKAELDRKRIECDELRDGRGQ